MADEFSEAGGTLIEGAKAGLQVAAEQVLALSLELCPEDTGTLRGSARIDNKNLTVSARSSLGTFLSAAAQSPYVIVGYGYGEEINPKTGRIASQYAVPVHERVEVRHEPPTQAKFLEDAMYEYSALFGTTVAEMMTAIESVSGPSILHAFIDWKDLIGMREAATGADFSSKVLE